MGTVIAIVSGKGGVGKTTAAINLSYAFNHFGRNVVLVDANLRAPHVGIMLGLPQVDKTLHHIIAGKHPIKDAAYLHYSGLKVILSDLVGKHAISPEECLRLEKALSEAKDLVELVVVDTAPGHTREAYHVLRAADFVVVITTPDMAAVTEALKTLRIAKTLRKQVLGVVVNRKAGKDHEMSNATIEKMLEYHVLAAIPEDDNVPVSANLKHPVVFSHPDAPSSKAYLGLAARLLGKKYSDTKHMKDEDSLFYQVVKRT